MSIVTWLKDLQTLNMKCYPVKGFDHLFKRIYNIVVKLTYLHRVFFSNKMAKEY
jgi:hypothetical protein